MGKYLIKNANIILENKILDNAAIFLTDGKIEKIDLDTELSNNDDFEVFDAKGNYIAPGFIDLHFHGIREHSTGSAEEIKEICNILPQYGVTAYLPTLVPCDTQEDDLKLMKDISLISAKGASILGVMLEGHFLSLTGAIKTLRKYNDDLNRVKNMQDALKPYLAIFAISPEYDGINALLPIMTKGNIPAFITHTKADFKQTERAIRSGAKHATHFYDVFPYIGDKEPGVRGCGTVEAIYTDPDVTVDFILDGEHVDPAAVKMAITCIGIDNVSLVTDANVNSGMGPGIYIGLGGTKVEVKYEGGPARGASDSHIPGGLTGSGLTMDLALRNAIKFLDVSIVDAVKMVSTNPAKVLHLSNRKGILKKGYDADIVMLDKELKVIGCWVNGERFY